MSYIVNMDQAANITWIYKADDPNRLPVPWTDPDFQAWNAVQAPPYTLSVQQTFLQQFKALTFQQWTTNQGITAIQKDAILQGMLKTYSIGVI